MSCQRTCDREPNDYLLLAQLYAVINSDDDFPDGWMMKDKALSKVLQKNFDIDYQVPVNQFFTFAQPQLIGCTALHIALKKLDLAIFKQLLDYNADFTIQDRYGNTVLHKAIEKSFVNHKKFWELKGHLKHPFVDSVLNAHVRQCNCMNIWNNDGISTFYIACMMNHVEAVRFFIECRVPVNPDVTALSSVFPGFTALHFAARYSSFKSLEILIDSGADVFAMDSRGYTALHILIERSLEILDCLYVQKQTLCQNFLDELDSNRKMIKIIFNKMNVRDDRIGLTYLHIACLLNSESMVKEIISLVTVDNFVHKDSPMWAGYTSLHFAAHVGMDMVKLLLNHGANIRAKDVNGVTPLDLCLERYTHEDIFYIIISDPILQSLQFSDDRTLLVDFVSALPDLNAWMKLVSTIDVSVIVPLNSPLWPGYSILHLTILFCDRVNRQNIYKTNDYFKTNIKDSDYLLRLFKNHYEEEEEKLYFQRIKRILDISANLLNVKDAFGSTPLHLAFRLQNRSVIKLLLQFTENIDNIVDKDGLSHLHIACAMRNKKLVQRILAEEEEIDVNSVMPDNLEFLVTDEDDTEPSVFFSTPGWTPLHLAVVTEESEIADILLKNGASIDIPDADNFTPLHRVFQLIDYYDVGINLLSIEDLQDNCSTDFGLNYLHVACLLGSECDVKRLLDLGADIEGTYVSSEYIEIYSDHGNLSTLKKYAGYTPLHIAAVEGHLSVTRLLIKRGANIFAKSPDGSVLSDLIFPEDSDDSPEFLTEFLEQNKKLLKKLKNKVGLTELHRHCFYPDKDEIDDFLIYNDVDINACIKSDSPAWPGKTALHFLVMHMLSESRKDSTFNSSHSSDDFFNLFMISSSFFGVKLRSKPYDSPPKEEPAKFFGRYATCGDFEHDYSGLDVHIAMTSLLRYGADVTVKDANKLTPVHLASELLFQDDVKDDQQDNNDESTRGKKKENKHRFPYCLVAGQKDFSTNPLDFRGMSHFHVACICDYVKSVQQFLKHGVDVNRPLEYFCNHLAGFTPLHLAAYYKSRNTVKILLKHGANVHAEDSLGNTPLHVAADRCNRYSNSTSSVDETIFEMLIGYGAQVDSQNLWGETPLAVLMRSGLVTTRSLEIFVRESHCCVNIFDIKTGKGLLAETLSRHSIRTIRSSYLFKSVINDRLKNNSDARGRTVIHNIVSTTESKFTPELYIPTIERFIKTHIDVNHQDEKGWTALHMAAYFKNYNGIVGLLENGADINLSDKDNMSALEVYLERSEEDAEKRQEFIGIFLLETHRLDLANLQVSRNNRTVMAEFVSKFILDEADREACKSELDLLKTEKIGATLVTWFDVLTHSNAFLCKLPESPVEFTNFFRLNPSSVRKKFPAFTGLLLMQYRNAADRRDLLEPAKGFFAIASKVNFPDLCSHYIINLLHNNDLKRLKLIVEEL